MLRILPKPQLFISSYAQALHRLQSFPPHKMYSLFLYVLTLSSAPWLSVVSTLKWSDRAWTSILVGFCLCVFTSAFAIRKIQSLSYWLQKKKKRETWGIGLPQRIPACTSKPLCSSRLERIWDCYFNLLNFVVLCYGTVFFSG